MQAEEFSPRGGVVVTPEKLGMLYSRFRIEGEVHPFQDIFHTFPRRESSTMAATGGSNRSTYHERIGDFFTDLECEYHLVPPSTTDAVFLTRSPSAMSVSSSSASTSSPSSPVFPRSSSHSSLHPATNPAPAPAPQKPLHSHSRPRSTRPSVPALTLAGFAKFFTICVLAHPDEEARRLNRIVGELALYADTGSTASRWENPPIIRYQWDGESLVYIRRSLPAHVLVKLREYPFMREGGKG
ncbi:hypothetical protein NUW58_g7881 [Xylaria curta]|uniref:Uncharacterized protein n=1 Tax=Xylaria curta TaxID=42375 RepID=A0ACC1NF20_9PEZI|nr:hypothetical protein NUW58_g7881 [Xylaria curta]